MESPGTKRAKDQKRVRKGAEGRNRTAKGSMGMTRAKLLFFSDEVSALDRVDPKQMKSALIFLSTLKPLQG